jgi:hypothetical protein
MPVKSNHPEQAASAGTFERNAGSFAGRGPQTATPIAALLAFSGLFAGLWSHDGSGANGTAVATVRQGTPGAVPVMRQDTPPADPADDATRTREAVRSVSWTVTLGGRQNRFSVETDGLMLSTAVLEKHLGQLPVGLTPGDYRIVDPLGGVGWLRVRGEETALTASSPPLLTTSVNENTVHFIRTADTPHNRTASATPRQRD